VVVRRVVEDLNRVDEKLSSRALRGGGQEAIE